MLEWIRARAASLVLSPIKSTAAATSSYIDTDPIYFGLLVMLQCDTLPAFPLVGLTH